MALIMASTISACSGEAHDEVTVTNAWARIADSGATGGAYVTIANNTGTDLTITGLLSAFADTVELHETAQHEGMTHMTPVADRLISSGDSLVMKPGGMHLMFVRLNHALVPGDSIPLSIHFKDRLPLDVRVPVRNP